MRVSNIMSQNVVTIGPTETLDAAVSTMKQFDIRHLPVVEQGKLIGLVTEGDLRGARFPAMIEELVVRDLMVSKPVTATPGMMMEDAARLIYRNKIGCLPVVDESSNLLGIVTIADMLSAFIEVMGFISASSRMDIILPDREDALEEAVHIIQSLGGSIIGVSLTQLRKDQPVHLFRLQKTNLKTIVSELERSGFDVVSTL